jgi:hypothetical protein
MSSGWSSRDTGNPLACRHKGKRAALTEQKLMLARSRMQMPLVQYVVGETAPRSP